MSHITAGIDEAGRGCWAGPLVAAAVVLRKPLPGLKDSKLLSRAQREKLAAKLSTCANIGIGLVDASDIDAYGLTASTSMAMTAALSQIKENYQEVVIDGSYNYLPNEPKTRTLVKADQLVPSVSAASIIAKVVRDRYMIKIAQEYPVYRFEKHVGYGTKLHLDMLMQHGLCVLHRKSYKPIQALL